MSAKKVAVVGLDGVAWSVLRSLFDNDAMPFLHRITKNSARGILKSTMPPTTPPAWTSIATGVNPGKHGVFDFVKFTNTYNTRILTSYDVQYPRIHEMVALKGMRSICINLPFTFPILKIKNSMVISDWIGPKIYTYPKDLEEYAREYSSYSTFGKFSPDALYREVVKRVKVINNIIENFDWNFFSVIFIEPDHILHRYGIHLGKYRIIREIFNEIDKTIEIFAKLSDLMVIVSDHGFSLYTHHININTFLERLGLIAKTYKRETKGIVDFKAAGKRNVKHVRISPRLHKILSRKPIKAIIKCSYKLFTGKDLKVEFPYPDPLKSKAFVPTKESFGIYVRDNSVVDLILDKLRRLECIKQVWKREEIYHGPYTNLAPHIIFAPDFDRGFIIGSTMICPMFISKHKSYYHHPDGIALFYGKDVSAGWLGTVNTVDIVPTIMKYLNLPLPHDTDGAPVQNIKYPSDIAKHYNYLRHWRLIKQLQLKKSKLLI